MKIAQEVEDRKLANKSKLTAKRLRYFEQKYDRILRNGLKEILPIYQPPTKSKKGRTKQHPAKNLLDRLVDFKVETLAFMYDFTVPLTNNLAERDIRMIKVKQKVSGCFRSSDGAKMFLRTRGYISTVRKNALNPLEALTNVFRGNPFIPA